MSNRDRLRAKLDEDRGVREAARLETPRFSVPVGAGGIATRAIAVAFSGFQLYTSAFGTFEQFIQRSVHLGFAVALIGLTYRLRLRRGDAHDRAHLQDWLFCIIGTLAAIYILFDYDRLMTRTAFVSPMTPEDLAAGFLVCLTVLEICRRTVSGALALIILGFVAYGLFGHYIPGRFGHPGLSPDWILETFFLSPEGIFGIPLGVSATYVFIFILFGGFITQLGLMSLLADIALAIAGSSPGGPAKVAILCSAFFGTISGSGIANSITTGSFTVPLMKKIGYQAHFAAGIEAAASMGGNIMPPIMGAAAFIMADFLGLPYHQVAIAAIIPAILYFFGAGMMVHFEALRAGLPRIPRSELPNLWKVLRTRGYRLLPVVGLLYFLITGRSAIFAGFWATVITIPVSFFSRETRIGPRKLVDALEWGALTALPVVAACGAVGMIIGILAQTGLGVKMASAILAFSGGNMFLTLFFAMIASLLLGTGLPTTPTYIITAALTAPALVKFGIPVIAAHFFVFYYGILADITPPTAIAPYALSGIAQSDPVRTCWSACMIALSGFIIPFLFVYQPAMLDPFLFHKETSLFQVIGVTGSAFVGIIMLSAALIGWLRIKTNKLERVILIASAATLIKPGWISDVIGLAGLGSVLAMQHLRLDKGSRSSETAAKTGPL